MASSGATWDAPTHLQEECLHATPAELNTSRIIELTRTIDALLLTWELKPSLNEVIAAQARGQAPFPPRLTQGPR
jgi:hypothetical protein